MRIIPLNSASDDAEREPTAADLHAIEAEWPVIAADLALLDAEISAAVLGKRIDELAVRRLRRAWRQALTTRVTRQLNRPSAAGGAA